MKYFLRKVGFFVLTLWAVVTLNFFIPRLQPGDPAELMVQKLAGKNAQLNPAQVAAIRDMLGTPTGSLWSQYWQYLGQLAHGNFGVSYTYFPFGVMQVIGQAFWWTVILVTIVQVLSFGIGVLLGAFAAWKRNGRFDTAVTLVSTFVGTLQPFWIALLLIYGLGYGLGWFATSGGYEDSTPGFNWGFVYDAISHGFLPALTLMIVTPVGWVLGMRNTMVLNLGEDYVRLAKAKGLPDKVVALRYAARNALLPSVTGFALALGGVLGGTILVETVFDYPGLGRLMGEAVGYKDYPMLQALMLLTAVATLLANLVADLLYGVLDPRARRAQA
ncbi:peptide/nickel transport system permease protein [Friedmanniella endophytica]|uniref:Peptide/nickel transport system permease protein n=1 Tax=Microlunatus kandeliicorticis TaxID=1759536 RepID=A0A7W3P588_9ACTN|nr:ABC transporter permease [Microlunatus kandeliicorticis]MBA8793693.1 peptide/nickel transport system permease protein [Microlunatus kandeliicorticis]